MKKFIRYVSAVFVAFFLTFFTRTWADPVEVMVASGGFQQNQYVGVYDLLVENIAFHKEVGIWGNSPTGWRFFAGNYIESVPGNKEIWRVETGSLISEFVGRYTVDGVTHWDNNGNNDYAMAPGNNCLTLGRPNLLLDSAVIDPATNTLSVAVDVKNLAFAKEVFIRYTTNGWLTFDDAFATYAANHLPGASEGRPDAESWSTIIPVGNANRVDFAVAYRVAGAEHWDNNFERNYTVFR